MFIGCIVAPLALAPKTVRWFGPATVSSKLEVSGDPYDPAENDVVAEFRSKSGATYRRIAFYKGDGSFAAVITAPESGKYSVRFLRNGRPVGPATSVTLTNQANKGPVQVHGMRFAYADGTPFFPIGYDYAWQSVPGESVSKGIEIMGANGANWSRIWACHWDGKNPFFPRDRSVKPRGRELQQEPLKIWDDVIRASEKSDVHFQFVLFHHGPYSTTVNSNWGEHPWNAANGGFLKNPADFFTDPEAMRRTKIWLRYAVARYAHSPSIFAWELFNEVEWVDAMKGRVREVVAWHTEMANYIRSIDPYHHMVTTSSTMEHPELYDAMDYWQPHTYPANVLAAIGGMKFSSKPGFFGEFGPPGAPSGPNFRRSVRDGIYGGILAGHAGAGMYWYWDIVAKGGLLPDYRNARAVIEQSGLKRHPNAKPVSLIVDTPKRGDLVMSAGMGWGQSRTFELNLPNVTATQLGGLSQYFQSLDGGHRDWAKPMIVRFNASRPGQAEFAIGQAAASGGGFRVFVNDRQAFDKTWTNAGLRETIKIDYPAGDVVLRLENHGSDWVRLDSIRIPEMAPTAQAHGMGTPDWALVRIVGSDASQVRVTGLPVKSGRYRVTVFDLEKSGSEVRSIDVAGGSFSTTNLPNESVLDFGYAQRR